MSEINKYKRDEEEKLKKIGGTIRKIRKESKVSQADLAASLQCSQDRISRIENGVSRMTLYELLMFCRRLDVDPNEVLGYPPGQKLNPETWAGYIEYSKLPAKTKKAISELVRSMD